MKHEHRRFWKYVLKLDFYSMHECVGKGISDIFDLASVITKFSHVLEEVCGPFELLHLSFNFATVYVLWHVGL